MFYRSMSDTPIVSRSEQLITTVINIETKEEHTVTAQYRGSEQRGYKVRLFLQDNQDKEIGDMICQIKRESDLLIPIPGEKEHPPHVYIVDMNNLSPKLYQHVGRALHEAAFRLSVKSGFEGRVRLEAVRNTHYFHYLCGFRIEDDVDAETYYKELANEIKNSHGTRTHNDFGAKILFLPDCQIAKNKSRYHLLDLEEKVAASSQIKPLWHESDPLAEYLKPAKAQIQLFVQSERRKVADDPKEELISKEQDCKCCLVM